MKNLLLIVLVLLFASCQLHVFKIADLRPVSSRSTNNEKEGQAWIDKMAIAHQIENWKEIDTYSVHFEDEFYGFMGKQAHGYKEQEVRFVLNYIPGTFDGRLDFSSGKQTGESWGIQSWNIYTIKNDAITFKKNKDIKFWLPTYQYFIEFPMRIRSATAKSYIGDSTIAGKECAGVVISWNTIEPQKDIDQYLVWISKETHRIVKLEYTIREMYKFLTGAVLYQDYQDYDGILLPSSMPVETNLIKEGKYLHKMSIQNFSRNTVSKTDLRPNIDLEIKGDEK